MRPAPIYTYIYIYCLALSLSLYICRPLAALQRGDHRGLRIWLMATALLGTVFLAGQTFEFTVFVREGVTLGQNLFGTTFFVLTGFHGAHVTIGVIMLLSFWVMSKRDKLSQKQSLNVELLGLYWHFVDVVWIVIFTVIYLFEAPKIVA